jgi:hypothetical protein
MPDYLYGFCKALYWNYPVYDKELIAIIKVFNK